MDTSEASTSSSSTRPGRKRKQRFDVSEVLAILNQSSNDDSGSDLDLDEFDADSSSDDSVESDSASGNAVTQLPCLPTPADRAQATTHAATTVRSKKGKATQKPSISANWTAVVDLSNDTPPAISDFTGLGGPTYSMPADAPPVKYFDRFFHGEDENGPTLWDLFVLQTNRYQQRYVAATGVLQKASKVHFWKPVDMRTMQAFIGTVINMGLNPKHGIEGYWDAKNYSQDMPMFRKVFTLNTFKLILRFFHTSDSDAEPRRNAADYDPTYKFRDVLAHLNASWAREFQLHRDISIDESIVGFKGRHVLVNYIRIKKHHQWGPKEYNIADTTGYVHKTIYHTAGMKVSEFGQPYDVCNMLLQGHFGKFHRLYVDNYYTSIDLCREMLKRQVYVTGTVRAKRKGLSPAINAINKKKDAIVAERCAGSGEILAISWVDRRQVRLLTTSSSVTLVDVTRHNKVRKIPQVVVDYNAGMGGIDKSDQMTDQYAGEMRTVKCWRKVVFHLLARTTTNAYICYMLNTNITTKRLTHPQFLIQLVEGLIAGYAEERKKVGRPSLGPVEARLTERHFIESIPDKKRRKCVVCANREEGFKGTRIGTWCKDCGVALCAIDCFKRYHTLNQP